MTHTDSWTREELYASGAYRFPPPPVPTAGWGDAAWIRFIDRDGSWIAYAARALADPHIRPYDTRRFLQKDEAQAYVDTLHACLGSHFEVIRVGIKPKEVPVTDPKKKYVPEDDPMLEEALSWLQWAGYDGVTLISHTVRKGVHLFRGKRRGNAVRKLTPERINLKHPPSDTLRLVAIVEDGRIRRLEEITTSERKHIQNTGKLPERLGDLA